MSDIAQDQKKSTIQQCRAKGIQPPVFRSDWSNWFKAPRNGDGDASDPGRAMRLTVTLLWSDVQDDQQLKKAMDKLFTILPTVQDFLRDCKTAYKILCETGSIFKYQKSLDTIHTLKLIAAAYIWRTTGGTLNVIKRTPASFKWREDGSNSHKGLGAHTVPPQFPEEFLGYLRKGDSLFPDKPSDIAECPIPELWPGVSKSNDEYLMVADWFGTLPGVGIKAKFLLAGEIMGVYRGLGQDRHVTRSLVNFGVVPRSMSPDECENMLRTHNVFAQSDLEGAMVNNAVGDISQMLHFSKCDSGPMIEELLKRAGEVDLRDHMIGYLFSEGIVYQERNE